MKCPYCKKVIENDSEFCVYCGKKITSDSRNKFEEEKTHGKAPVIIAGIVGVVALVTCICFVMLLVNKKQVSSVGETVASESSEKSSKDNIGLKTENNKWVEKNRKEAENESEISESTTDKKTEEVEDNTTEKKDAEYILPDSSQRILADSEVSSLSKSDLRLARNEISARHGRKFDDQELQDYFNSKSWYTGTINPSDFSESMLSVTEKANVETIKKYEQ